MDNLMTENIIMSLIYMISGIIIYRSLTKFKMRIARTFFSVLYGIMFLYLPLYFGGTFSVNVLRYIYDPESYLYTMFVQYTNETINKPFLLFSTLSIIAAVFAVVFIVAAVILAVKTVLFCIELINKIKNGTCTLFKQAPKPKLVSSRSVCTVNGAGVYLRFLRLLN